MAALGSNNQPLIVIVGPTASGKTALAIDLATQYGGEIICADSRTVYTGMAVGTAKPSLAEQARVPHWGIDLVRPDQPYNAALFQQYARGKIADIRSRGKVPFLVGGTGLYVDAVVYDYEFPEPPAKATLMQYQVMSTDQLVSYCIYNNINLPTNIQNKRHLLRAILHKDHPDRRRNTIIDNTIVVGITADRNVMRERIAARTEHMFADGVVEEANMLGKKYGWDSEAMSGNIYPILKQYIDQVISLDEAKQRVISADVHLAKRQKTWFQRNRHIFWGSADECRQRIQNYLAPEQQI